MRFDKEVQVVSESLTSDGFGGQIKGYVTNATINCLFTQMTMQEQIEIYGRETKNKYKLLTADDVSGQFIVSDGKTYRILSTRIYKRNRKVLVVEEVL